MSNVLLDCYALAFLKHSATKEKSQARKLLATLGTMAAAGVGGYHMGDRLGRLVAPRAGNAVASLLKRIAPSSSRWSEMLAKGITEGAVEGVGAGAGMGAGLLGVSEIADLAHTHGKNLGQAAEKRRQEKK